MKHFLLALATFIFSFTGNCQEDVSDSSYVWTPFKISYGTKLFHSDFYSKLNTLEKFSVQQPLRYVGLSMSGHFTTGGRTYGYWGHLSLLHIIPEKINIDGREGKLTGFVFSTSLVGFNLSEYIKLLDHKVDIIFSAGINTGRLRIYRDQELRQKNPFLAPMVSMFTDIYLGKFMLGFHGMYDYDISKTGWKRTLFSKSESLININGFRQTGLTTLFHMGVAW